MIFKVINKSCFVFLTLLLPTIAIGKEWALEDATKGWNTKELVTLYFHNSELQTQWAWKALSHYHFRGNEKVMDFGTGDGKLAALMSSMVDQGNVLGVDISEEMIYYASKIFPSTHYQNLKFASTMDVDFSHHSFSTKFDLITSFCVFHLVPNPLVVLKNIQEHLMPEGKLVVTYPIGRNKEFFKAASEEMEKRGWAFPAPTQGTVSMRNPEKIPEIFAEAGWALEFFEVVKTRTSFGTKEELTDWLEGTLTANWDIPKEGRREFFSDLTDRYLDYRPEDKGEEGFVYFSLDRVDIVARPSLI